jgi:hypothetical protein
MALRNIVRNALNPSYLPVMVQKLKLRVLNRVEDEAARRQSTAWCEETAEDLSLLAGQRDAQMWVEAQQFAEELADRGERRLGTLKAGLGGGGYYPLLYFLTRYRRPRVIVETGVAAGFSSAAFLAAIKANGGGHLFSSDFPLFRLEHPERYVGRLVDEDLHQYWTLFLRGDRKNLPAILRQTASVDLFHYDSDKTYSGRSFAFAQLEHQLAADAIVLMDDIQDNLFFRDYVQRRGCGFRVAAFEGKYVGIIGM